MRDRIRAVSARLGDPADDRRVSEWVDWAFAQRRGRAIQLTPILPIPIQVAPTVQPVTYPPVPRSQRGWLVMCLAAIVLVATGMLAYRLGG